LRVRFHHGATYAYTGVPESLYGRFMAASSKGTFFATNIKGVYQSRKL
jgi:hypothetical protein